MHSGVYRPRAAGYSAVWAIVHLTSQCHGAEVRQRRGSADSYVMDGEEFRDHRLEGGAPTRPA